MECWLEYLNDEQWWARTLTTVVKSLPKDQYHQPFRSCLTYAERIPELQQGEEQQREEEVVSMAIYDLKRALALEAS